MFFPIATISVQNSASVNEVCDVLSSFLGVAINNGSCYSTGCKFAINDASEAIQYATQWMKKNNETEESRFGEVVYEIDGYSTLIHIELMDDLRKSVGYGYMLAEIITMLVSSNLNLGCTLTLEGNEDFEYCVYKSGNKVYDLSSNEGVFLSYKDVIPRGLISSSEAK